LRDGEAVREHDRLGAAVATAREQFERASLVRLGAAAAAALLRAWGRSGSEARGRLEYNATPVR